MQASVAVSPMNATGSPVASGATTDTDMTAMVELVVTLRCRLLPITAYAARATMAVTIPTDGGIPASPAYASATGTMTPQEVRDDTRSARSHSRGYVGSQRVMGT